MRFLYSTPPKELDTWLRWYAWHPVYTVNKGKANCWVWLEDVERYKASLPQSYNVNFRLIEED